MARTKSVNIFIDGETKSFRLGNNEMCEFEELTGENILDLFADTSKKIKLSTLRAVIYVGLKHNDRALTLEKVGDMMDFAELTEYTKSIIEAISISLSGIPQGEGGDTGKK